MTTAKRVVLGAVRSMLPAVDGRRLSGMYRAILRELGGKEAAVGYGLLSNLCGCDEAAEQFA